MSESARSSSPDSGILLCDKPAGVTSHTVVERIRRRYATKVGHGGTLDPFATGLLVVLLGRATRLQRYLLPLPKTYLATARLGWRSTTGDPDGELTRTDRIPERLELPVGRIRQRVPMTSAVRVGGERLYKRAHRGESVERPEREVEVYRAELVEHDGEQATFEIECSAGTYVRTLIETLEDAYCSALRRTAVGALRLADAGEQPLDPAEALSFLPARALDPAEAVAASHGRAIAPDDSPDDSPGDLPVRLMHDDRLIAVARRRDGMLRPEVVLAPGG